MPNPDRSLPRRGRGVGAVLALAAVTMSCTGGDSDAIPSTTLTPTTTTVPERVNDGIVSIGVFLPLTGSGASIGPPMVAGIEAAVAQINAAGGLLGQDVELTVVDEASGTIDELLADGVDAIVGPASSLVALSSLGPAVDPNSGVVTCSPMATALALDDYPDRGGFFFRTAPSDSLQMEAIARQAERTGAQRVAIGYLDDPYGRGLENALTEAMAERPVPIATSVGFVAEQNDLTPVADELLAEEPGVIVVLGDADDGSRLLAALDAEASDPPQIIINDSIRSARQIIQGLSPTFLERLVGVAPLSDPGTGEAPMGFFVAHAIDCVNLIALATTEAESDNPVEIRKNVVAVSTGGRTCQSFEACAALADQNLGIDYNGLSGPVDLSNTTGDPVRARFEIFGFDDAGNEVEDSTVLVDG